MDPDGLEGTGPAEEPAGDVPDTVPDDLSALYGPAARKTVLYRRSRRYAVAKRARGASEVFHDRDMWFAALMIFACSVIGLAVIGALAYAIVLWPVAAMFILIPLVALFVLSIAVALRVTRRRGDSSGFTPS